MVTNHRPKVSGDDPALWRRIRTCRSIPSSNRRTPCCRTGWRSSSRRSSWSVAGYLAYAARGLDAPAAVTRGTDEYRTASDHLGRFLGSPRSPSHRRTSEPATCFQPGRPGAMRTANYPAARSLSPRRSHVAASTRSAASARSTSESGWPPKTARRDLRPQSDGLCRVFRFPPCARVCEGERQNLAQPVTLSPQPERRDQHATDTAPAPRRHAAPCRDRDDRSGCGPQPFGDGPHPRGLGDVGRDDLTLRLSAAASYCWRGGGLAHHRMKCSQNPKRCHAGVTVRSRRA
jgi:hypothetical protein